MYIYICTHRYRQMALFLIVGPGPNCTVACKGLLLAAFRQDTSKKAKRK